MALASKTHKPVTRKGKQESNNYLTKDPSTLDPKEITDELIQDIESALNELRASISQKENDLMDSLVLSLSGFSGPIALGRDRAYRRYWLSRGLSGLLVESPGIDSKAERKALLAEARLCKQFKSDERFALQHHSKNSDNTIKYVTSWDNTEQIAEGHPVHSQWEHLVQENCNGSEKWYFYPDMISVDELSESLNQRGFRESSLKAALIEFRSAIEDAIDFCPVENLSLSAEVNKSDTMGEMDIKSEEQENGCSNEQDGSATDSGKQQKVKMVTFGVKSRSGMVHGRVNSDSASEWMELNLRESLLDLEERIYAGALGNIRVENRERWRHMLENGGYEPLVSKPLVENEEKPSDKVAEVKEESEIDDDSNATVAAKLDENYEKVVRDLSSALIQIANGIQSRFIIAPLGDHDQATKEAQRKAKIQAKLRKMQDRERMEKMRANRQRTRSKQNVEENSYVSSSSEDEENEDNVLSTYEQWQQGLMKTTSISQISLYLSALDRSISWSKSLLKARCKLCRRKGDDSQLLLCDGCDGGFHMYCLKPRLTKIPVGDWFCPKCRPPDPEPEPRRRKRRSKVYKAPVIEESDDDDNEETSDQEESNTSENDAASNESEEEEEEEEDDDEEETDDNETSDCDDAETEEEEEKVSDDNTDNSRRTRRSGRIQHSLSDRTTKVRLPLVTPKRSSNGSVASRISGRRSNNSEKTANENSVAGIRSRLKRGHPDAEALRDIELLINELSKQDSAWPFLNAVRKAEVPDYYDIIKHPMDIGSMRVNFNSLVYDNPQQPMVDLWRIFSNCQLYNQERSEEYQCSIKLRRFAERRIKELGLTKYVEKAIQITRETSLNSTPPSKKRTRIT